MKVMQPAVAGKFYSDNPDELLEHINFFIENVSNNNNLEFRSKGLIIPHAGYAFSGICAASAYRHISQYKDDIKKILILGPAHKMAFDGICTTSADALSTPLGLVKTYKDGINKLTSSGRVKILEEAFVGEHGLEVHLPFLQTIINNDFEIVPLLFSSVSFQEITWIIEQYWRDSDTLTIISSDLSHFHPYDVAQKIDEETASWIINCNIDAINSGRACGSKGIQALLNIAQRENRNIVQLDRYNSGDTPFGDKKSVVGYGTFCVY